MNYIDPTGHSAIKTIVSKVVAGVKKLVNAVKEWWGPSEKRANETIKSNSENIKTAAEKYNVNPKMVATAIYTEHRLNVDKLDTLTDWLALMYVDMSVGLGQVKMSTAYLLEKSGYISSSNILQEYVNDCDLVNVNRYVRLCNDKSNSEYVAAYLRLIIDEWEDEYPQISEDPAILMTLYNIGVRTPHSDPKANYFGEKALEYYENINSLLEGN